MRDIEKDKEYVKYAGGFEELEWPLVMECCYIAQHYINQYEAAQARISELEAAALLHTRQDVATLPEHDRALDTVLRELPSHIKPHAEVFAEAIEKQLRLNAEVLAELRKNDA